MIDIREINIIRFNEGVKRTEGEKMGISVKRNTLTGSLNFIYSFFQSFFIYPRSFKRLGRSTGGAIIIYSSKNQLTALRPINDYLEGNALNRIVSLNDLPFWRSYLYSLRYIKDFIVFYKSCSKEDKLVIGNELNAFLRSYGDYRFFTEILKKRKPDLLILANDHASTFRAALMAANDMGVKTLYVQHAAVTNKFPQMISTYSFLDGIDSYEKYFSKGIYSDKVFLIGGSRFDLAVKNNNIDNRYLGVALTLKDDTECWQQVVSKLMEQFPPEKIIVRPHPAMDREMIYGYCHKKGINYSDPIKENSFSFLSKLENLIANETSIHLDAVIMHVPTILCSCLSNRPFTDHYGFVKSNVVERVNRLDELIPSLLEGRKKNPSDEYVRRFNASYNTIIEGHVSEIIAKFVNSVLQDTDFSDKRLVCKDNIYTINLNSL